MLRELNLNEMETVSGGVYQGEIVVTGQINRWATSTTPDGLAEMGIFDAQSALVGGTRGQLTSSSGWGRNGTGFFEAVGDAIDNPGSAIGAAADTLVGVVVDMSRASNNNWHPNNPRNWE